MFEPFSAIAERYRVIFFDAYGVLKNSKGVFAGAPAVLADLRDRGKQLFVLTNDASRDPVDMVRGYSDDTHGQLITEKELVSSGLLATEFLSEKVRQGIAAYLGPPSSRCFIEAAGLQAFPVAAVVEADVDIAAIVLLDEEGFDWFQDINATVNLARRYPVPLLVANSDLAYPVGTRNELAVAIGSVANMIEGILGRRFIHCGKPDPMMFNYAYERARAADPTVTKADIVMVGDNLGTDIFGANRFGLDTVLVASGTVRGERAPALIEATGVIPTYLCESIFT